MTKEFKLHKDKYYKSVLKAFNLFIGLTEYELEIISLMLVHNIRTLSKESRIILRSKLGADTGTFNNYIKRLKDKKALVKNEDGIEISDAISSIIKDGELNLKFTMIKDEVS